MPSSTAKTVIRSRPIPAPVRIVNWPLKDEGVWSWLQVAVMSAGASVCGLVSGSTVLGVVCFVALASACWRLWIPVEFTFSSRGITQSVLGRIRRVSWSDIARYKLYQRGIMLFADHDETPLAPVRGLYIRWHGQRDELLQAIRFFVDRPQADTTATQTQHGPRASQMDSTSAADSINST